MLDSTNATLLQRAGANGLFLPLMQKRMGPFLIALAAQRVVLGGFVLVVESLISYIGSKMTPGIFCIHT